MAAKRRYFTIFILQSREAKMDEVKEEVQYRDTKNDIISDKPLKRQRSQSSGAGAAGIGINRFHLQ